MKELMKGNEAIAEAAVRGGCRAFFGYPITPQNEIPEYMSWRLFEVGGTYVQAESEVAAINMVYGAAGAGARAMTSSSSPGISLKQEGISYICGARLPCVIVNMVRGGPGLGGIQPAQSDYFQATKGGGHGDYHLLVYGPSSVQECVDIMYNAFDVSDKYRVPVMILGDGMLGQIMEPVELPEFKDLSKLPRKPWATYGDNKGKDRQIVNSLLIEPDVLEAHCHLLEDTYKEIAKNETAFENYLCDDAEVVITAYGAGQEGGTPSSHHTVPVPQRRVRKSRKAGLRKDIRLHGAVFGTDDRGRQARHRYDQARQVLRAHRRQRDVARGHRRVCE